MENYQILHQVRAETPLVHCITNIVVANFQANGLLAIGASPVMADAVEEAAEIAAVADCTVLNIGTLRKDTVEAMILAGRSANTHGTPIVLDPVGAGATPFRRGIVFRILNEVDVSLIRCNAGELAAIAGVEWRARGVDAGEGDVDLCSLAKETAQRLNCLVAVTGAVDILSDGEQVSEVVGGHSLMSKITGSGCLLSAVVGAFLAVRPNQSFDAAAEALTFYKRAGEKAAQNSQAPGHFAMHFLDELYLLGEKEKTQI
ncbi:hydroxyethylthiazole kinase [Lederbergia sp. NSJ-179]|uniref:hydroxyethylthiazole kinase n=1 Tax=Lederbergia sp. NSJ-179 TaxID=2931402 RepID=UPI001FCFB523|nr:hydroxyethylthiazole kinase [Lederbergia sp. NSJ-179]MCJ7841009.1 hydroxyethylthiazole kinase [Lederbergia sp. NSJ-179]